MTVVLEAEGVAVGHGPTPLLTGVDLTVHAGERWALLGENGCGKTTLLRAFAGLHPLLAGRLRWEGSALPEGAGRVRALGVLFQHEAPSAFRVRELVTLGLALDGPPADDDRARVDAMLATTELIALADRTCATLSGGEAQRSLLARALVAGPRLLLLDEPTNHLDPARQAAFLATFEHRREVAIVLATHDLALAARCDRIVLLHGARVHALGTPAEILTPSHLREALGVEVQRLEDPHGGPPWLRVQGPARDAERARASVAPARLTGTRSP